MSDFASFPAEDVDHLRHAYRQSLHIATRISEQLAQMPKQLDACSDRLLDEWYELCEELQEHVRRCAIAECDSMVNP